MISSPCHTGLDPKQHKQRCTRKRQPFDFLPLLVVSTPPPTLVTQWIEGREWGANGESTAGSEN